MARPIPCPPPVTAAEMPVRNRSSGTALRRGRRDPEDRVVGRDAQELVVACIRSDPVEERPDLPFPALQVLPQDRRLLLVGDLAGGEVLSPAPEQQPAAAAGA